jgi:hypothetical protein
MKLQLDDINDILQGLASSVHDTNGEVAAFKAHRDELQRRWDEVNSQCIAMQILRDENNNRLAFTRLLEEERQAQNDHVIACNLAGLQPPGGPDLWENRCGEASGSDVRNYMLNGPPIEVDKIVFILNPAGVPSHLPGPVDIGKGKGKADPDDLVECVCCMDDFPRIDVLQLDCKGFDDEQYHAYCKGCMEGLFNSCITDPSMFPPSCCAKHLNITTCIPLLTSDMIDRFYDKEEELGTTDRTYCSDADCAKWVTPANIEADIATCSFCFRKTCTTCKGKQHEGLCPEDEGTQQLMLTAKKKEWKTCPNCKNMVELESGCYHISCAQHPKSPFAGFFSTDTA